uniref:DH domain-containing protein n=1 Tax=Paramoeba aestuarina TaxID=180227 RepID=A0A7S4PB18_9EUKA|eukprot:CAMPEP_0201507502 /NCGR_PEP_ID=MMETSP0161_2-20130828/1139_1 /ASSEMBLY_ACC=CAM_ASM_000251 /TAXON_ID=180227 /ORGANISM="Neoparamoeba aestuarina, Strain SoJaBio B1-5/56/2" /LENGTH=712 /DNA_ID=CAMNT_0047901887 /DNA_START=144 /DNA_END=2282 /DNA_ORIENTATION=+
MDDGALPNPNGPPPTVPSRNRAATVTGAVGSTNSDELSAQSTPVNSTPTKERQRTKPSLSHSTDMWKHFSQLSLSENSLQENCKEDIKKAKPKIDNWKPSKYTQEEAIPIIQRAWRMALAMRKMIKRKKNQRTRLNIMKEMVDTEQTYVSTLETIFYKFELPMRAAVAQEKEIITEDEMKTIFSSCEVILGFSSHLLQRLKDRYEEWKDLPPAKQCVADIFVEMTSYTKVYVSYVSNYDASTALCSQLRKKNERFKQWETDALAQIPGNHSTIGFLLITPVQRIPRYLMLVQTMLKACWEGHQDIEGLSTALESIKETATIVDKRTAETERMQKISEIEDSISGKFETLREAKRRYVMEGELDVLSDGKAGKTIRSTRYFFLFNDLLVVCKYAKMGSLRGSLKGSLKSKKGGAKSSAILFEFRSRSWLATDEKVGSVAEKENMEGISHIFEINLPSAKFTVAASSDQTKAKWMEELKEAFVELEPKVQFKQDVAKKMSSEKAKRARALIAQQYAHLRVEEQRGELEEETGEGGEGSPVQQSTPPASNQRRFRAHRNDMTDMKMHEKSQQAEENMKSLAKEEQDLRDAKEEEKRRKEEDRKQAFEAMTNRYKKGPDDRPASSLASLEQGGGPSSPDREGEKKEEKGAEGAKKKKTRRRLALDENASSSSGDVSSASPKRPESTPPSSASPLTPASPDGAPKKRAFRRLADETR